MAVEIEVRATRIDADNEVIWCVAEHNDAMFSVYVGCPGAFCCLRDFTTEVGAMDFARALGNAWGVKVFNRIEHGEPA